MATIPLTDVEMGTMSNEPQAMSVEQYLDSAYSPDCDYVDGFIEERNLGEYEHGRIQTRLAILLGTREAEWGVETIVEVRLQVASTRFRIPDLMVLKPGQRAKRIVREAPLICIEVLSPKDTWKKMRARLTDYLAMGVEHLWCFDPDTREARIYTAAGFTVVINPDLIVPHTAISLNLAELFSILD